ncbi:MAG: 30S ribosomal protein S11 [Rickettsiaceae bacterium]|nr:MAG: 30S ribosomal protein S11 [Rickettsiaceae bacterium]
MSTINKVKKKKKNITLGVAHIKATFNNTIVTITDVQGNCIAMSTSGAQGLKGTKKATPFAAQLTVEKASQAAIEHGVKTVSIRVRGAGIQRESAMRAVFQNFIVTSIIDVSPVAHNGCRAPKRRRV